MNTWVLNFANSVVGVGVLAIPFCFHVCGIGIATLMVLVTNVITKRTCEYLLKAGQLTRKSGYETLAEHLLGPMGKLITELSIIGLLLGTLISFQVVIGDLSPGLFNSFFGFKETWSLRTLLMCISSMGVIPLALMRNLSSLANMNALSMGFYCTFIVVVFLISFKNILNGDWLSHVNLWKPSGIFHCLPILSLAFSCQAQVFVMYEAIPEPSIKSMMDIINKAINLVTVMYLSVGMFGYVAFYETGIRGDILSNFPNGILSDSVKAGFWISIMMSFPLIIFPLRIAINSLLFSRDKKVHSELISSADDYIPQHRFTGITLLLIGGTLIVGILIPHIETVLSVTGAVIGTFLCFVFPAGLFILATQQGSSERTISKVVFVIGVVCMIASTMAVLSGGSSEAHHEEHSAHEEKHPLFPNPQIIPNLPAEKLQKVNIDGVVKKDVQADGAVKVENKQDTKENVPRVAITARTVTVMSKTGKPDIVHEKGDVRKLQQVNNESKNGSPVNDGKDASSPEKISKNDDINLAKGTLTSDGSNIAHVDPAEKPISRVKKDEGSDIVDQDKVKSDQERINSDQGKNIIENQIEPNREKPVSDQKSGLADNKEGLIGNHSTKDANMNSHFTTAFNISSRVVKKEIEKKDTEVNRQNNSNGNDVIIRREI